MNPCAIPCVPDDPGDGRWMSQHECNVREAKEREPDVLFIGDSIIHHLSQRPIWADLFEPLHCLNFGIPGDTTQNVLWRLHHGEIDNINPKVVVILIGTNNTTQKSEPEDIADALVEIVRTIKARLPESYIVLIELLPRGEYPNSLRERNSEVNFLVRKKLSGLERLETISLSKGLVDSTGRISHHDMPDYLHLSEIGYRKAFTSLHELITQLLNNEQEKDLTPSE
uniref:Putative attractin and platelet-activating factor acetylhydrolase n=1 Tax=Triatoma dimidiata TaxID=72491 RepID=A0A0V0GAD6_TRIDM